MYIRGNECRATKYFFNKRYKLWVQYPMKSHSEEIFYTMKTYAFSSRPPGESLRVVFRAKMKMCIEKYIWLNTYNTIRCW